MRIIQAALLLALVLQGVGCAESSKRFEMTVDQVDELKGLIMRGISFSGSIARGCIANDDEFMVERNGKEVLRTTARIVNVRGLTNSDSFTGRVQAGEYVTLFLPDGKKGNVVAGDMVVSDTTSCDVETKPAAEATAQQ